MQRYRRCSKQRSSEATAPCHACEADVSDRLQQSTSGSRLFGVTTVYVNGYQKRGDSAAETPDETAYDTQEDTKSQRQHSSRSRPIRWQCRVVENLKGGSVARLVDFSHFQPLHQKDKVRF